jgi:anti-sigma-K factor RskA
MTSAHAPRFDDLLPAYALGALDGDELRELEAHLATGCPSCEDELRRLAAELEGLALDAAEIPESLAGEAPRVLGGVKRRLLAQIAAEPRSIAAPPLAAAGPARALAVFGRRHAPDSPADHVASPARRWPLLAAAAVLALVAAWGLARQASMGAEIERLRGERRQLAARASAMELQAAQVQAESQRLARVLAIIAAPGVQSVSLAGMGTSHSAAGRTWIDPADHRAAFYASNLPALGPDKSYQLWYLDREDQKTSAGVFDVDAHGTASLVIDQPVPAERIEGWVVTVEPRGGRPQPTGSMALAG